jgi:hypothetical protein
MLSGVSWTQTEAGNAISLDGIDDFLQVVHLPELQFDGSLTISVWMRTTTVNNSSLLMQYECGNYCPNASSAYQIGIVDQRCQFYLRDSSDVSMRVIDTLNYYNDGNWHLITGVRDFENSLQLLYVDGVLVGSAVAPNGKIGDDDGEEDPLVFGGKFAAGGSWIEDFFNGEIDEIRIWNVARTREQIIATMLDTLTIEYYSSTDSGLVGYWRFDEFEDLGVNGGGADDIRDFSVNANHADAEGLPTLVPSGALVSVSKEDAVLPDKFYLAQNYPNPFNPSTTISFSLPEVSYVSLKVFNALGEEIETLVTKELSAGNYKYDWNAINLPSGIYFYKLQSENFVETKKMILLK